MKYFSIVRNPFSTGLQNQLKKLVDKNMLTDSVLLQLLPIDGLKHEINAELEKHDLRIEHILLFYRPASTPIDSHVDLFVDGTVCKSSLVLPWICKDGYSVYWEQGNFDLSRVSPDGHDDVEYFEMDWKSNPEVCYQTKIHTPVVVKTDIPHGVYSLDSKLLLATIRFEGNPSFDELCTKLMVE
jgi:hypothetical protein